MNKVINNKLDLEQELTKIKWMETFERELFSALADSKGRIREMCSHILATGGKRIRPMLVIQSGLIFSQLDMELIQAAVASELIHMASLIHDDIIDNSVLRRSKPSINEVWGNQFAVLSGDYLFAKAFEILSRERLLKSMDLMVEAIENMCHGEILQAGDKFKLDTDENVYYDRISKKTAIFLQNCCKSGAEVAGADKEKVEALGAYGLNLGYAYQIFDDIMDFCGDSNKMGKPKKEDLRQGIITLPVILLLRDEKYGDWLKQIIINRDFSQEMLKQVDRALSETGILMECYKTAELHLEKADQYLQKLQKSEFTAKMYDLTDMLHKYAGRITTYLQI